MLMHIVCVVYCIVFCGDLVIFLKNFFWALVYDVFIINKITFGFSFIESGQQDEAAAKTRMN